MIHSTPSLGFLLLFLHQKWQLLWLRSYSNFGWHMWCINLVMTAYLFKVHFYFFFLRGRLCFNRRTTDKTWFFIIICHFTMNRKGSGIYVHFSTNFFIFKKASIKSDQYHVPVQRNRTISGLSVANWSRYMRRLQSDDWLW